MLSSFYWLAIASLVVWRVTHLLQAEDGPWNVIVRLRRLAGKSAVGDLLDCFYCLSLWIAAPLACLFGANWQERLLLWPALSGAAILLERFSNRSTPVVALQEGDVNDVLLRQKSSATAEPSSNNTENVGG
jgi:hypothetical protein